MTDKLPELITTVDEDICENQVCGDMYAYLPSVRAQHKYIIKRLKEAYDSDSHTYGIIGELWEELEKGQ